MEAGVWLNGCCHVHAEGLRDGMISTGVSAARCGGVYDVLFLFLWKRPEPGSPSFCVKKMIVL